MEVVPVLESPPDPAGRNLRLPGASLHACIFCDKFEIVGLMVFPSELRQPTWRLLFTIFDVIHMSEEELRREKNVGAFDLEACEVAQSLQARLAGSHGFWNRVIGPIASKAGLKGDKQSFIYETTFTFVICNNIFELGKSKTEK